MRAPVHVEAACSDRALREELHHPMRVGPWRVGTDATWLLGSRDDLPAAACPARTAEFILAWLDDAHGDWREMRVDVLRALMGRPVLPERCPECDGRGNDAPDCDVCRGTGHYLGDDPTRRCADCACWLCDGTGSVMEKQPRDCVQAGGLLYDCRLLASVLAHVETPGVQLRQMGDVLVLRWDGGRAKAVVMRCQGDFESVEVLW